MSDTIKTKEVYTLMKAYVEAGLADKAVKKCNSIYQFDILDKPQGKKVFSFWIDVTEAGQKVGEGDHAKPDATFEVSDEDFFKMCTGKLNPQMAFIKRQMKIKGNFKKASAFTPDLFPQPTPENIEKYGKMAPKL